MKDPQHCVESDDTSPVNVSITDVFAEQVRLHRARDAIITEKERISYGEFDLLTDRIARSLTGNGLQHGQPVAILAEQGILQIAAIFGALKAGGIFVPLDSALGRNRLAALVEHSDAAIILADHLNLSTAILISGGKRPVTDIENAEAPVEDHSKTRKRRADDLACIYYTSGTTGQPKGVVDSDRNVLHNIQRYTTSLEISHQDRLTLVQSCGFSGAASNIFAALLNGACLLPFDLRSRGMGALANWLRQQRPSIYHSVPTLFRRLMSHCDTLPSLRIIRLEGDLIRSVDIDVFNRHFNQSCTLVNGLGATETGLTAQQFIAHGEVAPEGAVPVGKPMRDISIEVVDEQGCVVPQEITGEVRVTSRYLAVGYWREPTLTRAAFNANEDGTRSYRTGDLGRINEDGLLELHGRVDGGGKILGQWINLRELESALVRISGVQDAIAEIAESASQDLELRAWILSEQSASLSGEYVISKLRSKNWPAHALPTRITQLQRWPLDMHGKVDRGALPGGDEGAENSPPLSPQEHLVASVFEQVLQVSGVSRRDDFFALGGDSLKAVEAGLELNLRTGSQRALSAIQHASTVEGLAALLDGSTDHGCMVPLQPLGSKPALFCVHAHMGHVLNLRNLAVRFASDQPFYGLRAKGLDGCQATDTTMASMVNSYLAEIKKVQRDGPYLLAGYCFGSWVAVEMARTLQQEGHQVSRLFLIDPELPVNLGARTRTPVAQMIKRRFNRARESGMGGTTRLVAGSVSRAAQRARNDFLASLVRLSESKPRLRELFLRRPSDAISAMHRNYRPLGYDGDAVVLVPGDSPDERRQPEFWCGYFTGSLRIDTLVGSSADLMREPYSRDLAARILMRITT